MRYCGTHNGGGERIVLPDGIGEHEMVLLHEGAKKMLSIVGMVEPDDHSISLLVYAALNARLRLDQGGIN